MVQQALNLFLFSKSMEQQQQLPLSSEEMLMSSDDMNDNEIFQQKHQPLGPQRVPFIDDPKPYQFVRLNKQTSNFGQ